MKASIKTVKSYPASYYIITLPDGSTERIYNAQHAYSRLKYLNKSDLD